MEGEGRRQKSRNKSDRKRKKLRKELHCKHVLVPCLLSLTKWYTIRYGGYNEQMINRFVFMGFDLDRVVSAFDYVGIDPNDGEDYELEEAYIGDITARLLGEP